jgi:6-phosphogluconolactonase
MSAHRSLQVFETRDELVAGVAEHFQIRIALLLKEQPFVHVGLTGGTVGIAVLAALDPRTELDWSRIHLWWGDERWVPAGHPDRNEVQANVLLERITLPATNVHRFPAAAPGYSLEDAVDHAEIELAEYGDGALAPAFDVLFLGVGPDAHIASLFPGMPEINVHHGAVVAVRNSPKPPPERLSLTLPIINRAKRIWIVAAGEDKAQAVRQAFTEADRNVAPVSAAHGTLETAVFTDRAAASLMSAH